MKIHFALHTCVAAAFTAVFGLFDKEGDMTRTENPAEADCIVVTDRKTLNSLIVLYPHTVYVGIDTGGQRNFGNLPHNVLVVNFQNNVLMEFINRVFPLVKYRIANPPAVPRPRMHDFNVSDLPTFDKTYNVMVVDDTQSNLDGAVSLLTRASHTVTPVNTFHEAFNMFAEGRTHGCDAVLLDMQMPILKFGSLSETMVNPVGSEPAGFALMLMATAAGCPVAIVSDGNHHTAWTSAFMDRVKSTEILGKKVLFFNNLGKRWDIALKKLMEPEAISS